MAYSRHTSMARLREELRALRVTIGIMKAAGYDDTAAILERLSFRMSHYSVQRLKAPQAVPVAPLSPLERREPVDPGIAVFAAMAQGHRRTTK